MLRVVQCYSGWQYIKPAFPTKGRIFNIPGLPVRPAGGRILDSRLSSAVEAVGKLNLNYMFIFCCLLTN